MNNQQKTFEYDLIVWDLETTGFVAPECKIIEVGAYLVKGDEVTKKHWVLDNKCEIPEKIIEITGITPEIIAAEGRNPKECLNEFLPFFKLAEKNVTHNGMNFDITFLTNYAEDLLGWTEVQKNAVRQLLWATAFDTAVSFKSFQLKMGRRKEETYQQFAKRVMNVRSTLKFNLGHCCDEHGIDRSNVTQHRALGDVELTYLFYKKLNESSSVPKNAYDFSTL